MRLINTLLKSTPFSGTRGKKNVCNNYHRNSADCRVCARYTGDTSVVAKLYSTVIALASRLKFLVRVVENMFCWQTRRDFGDEVRANTPKTMTWKFVAAFFFFDIVISTKKNIFLLRCTPENRRLEKRRERTQLNLRTRFAGLNYFSAPKTETHTITPKTKNINTIKSFTTFIGLGFTLHERVEVGQFRAFSRQWSFIKYMVTD